MKKIALFLVVGLFVIEAHAKVLSCGYKDYFHLNDEAHPLIYISSANSDPELSLHVIGPRTFEIRDTERCQAGYLHVTVAYDAFNWCLLDIKDGPYMAHPLVSSFSCSGGMRYKGLSYDGGFRSHSYTINLD